MSTNVILEGFEKVKFFRPWCGIKVNEMPRIKSLLIFSNSFHCATPKVENDILKNLQIENASIFKSSFNRPNLFYEVRSKTDD